MNYDVKKKGGDGAAPAVSTAGAGRSVMMKRAAAQSGGYESQRAALSPVQLKDTPGTATHHDEHGEHAEHASHNAHLAHEAHLAAEGVEAAGHQIHHAAEYAKHLEAARKLTTTHSQMAVQLRKMSTGITKLQNVVKNGGGPKAVAKLAEARQAYAAAQAAFAEEKAAVAAASELVAANKAVQAGAKGRAMLRLGQAAKAFEVALQGSRIGRLLLSTGRILAHPAFAKSMMVLGAIFSGIHGWMDSNATTTGGRVANAGLDAAGGALIMANPIVAGADFIAPEGYKLSEVYHGGAGAVSAIGEGLVTGDTRSMDKFHTRSKKGDYGKVMQAASEAGDYWAEHGVVGGLALAWDAIW